MQKAQGPKKKKVTTKVAEVNTDKVEKKKIKHLRDLRLKMKLD
jgi:hypothetical protein